MKNRIIDFFTIVCVTLLIFITLLRAVKADNSNLSRTPDLTNHPVYSNYKFNNSEEIINIGVQPIYTPTGFITEVMKRDAVLHKVLSELGMKAKFYAFLKGDDVNFFLLRGCLDAGIGGDMPAITASVTLNIVIPTIIQQGFTSIIAKNYMLIRDLRGKKIGYAFGSNAHYALLKALSSEEISEAQVNLIPMEVNKMPEALQAGKITAFSAWEPFPTITLTQHSENVVIHRYLSSGYLYFVKDFLDRHPECVRQIIAAEIRALRWIQSSRQNLLQASEWALAAGERLINQKLELTVEQNASMAEDDIIGLISEPIIPYSSLKQNGLLHLEFEFLKTVGKISATADWDKVSNSFDRKIIIEVLADSEKYKLNEFNYNIE